MLLLGNFAINLFCALIPCPVKFAEPGDPLHKARSLKAGRSLFSNLIEEPLTKYPIVNTKNGKLEGFTIKTISAREIYAFEGIPYGENTGGQNRFKSPVPKYPWSGVKEAKKPGPHCPQIHPAKGLIVMGSEDCLYLNVFTPMLPKIDGNSTENKLPVVVWIHGGGFATGAGSEYGPAYMLDNNDIIYVSVNYRLGVLGNSRIAKTYHNNGFLSTGDSISPGNYGLKDQALAIRWVHENINQFGGDNSKITAMGQSAGAASVHYQLISNQSRGYFSAGISLSGTAFNQWALQSPKIRDILNTRLSKQSNCPLENSKIFVDCLKSINTMNLVRLHQFLIDWIAFPAVMFAPVVEPPSEDAFLTETPREAYRQNHVAKIPWISTRTADDGLLPIFGFYAAGLLNYVVSDWGRRSPIFLDYHLSAPNPAEITQKIQNFYMKDVQPKDVNITVLSDLSTDRLFSYGLHSALKAHCKIAPTFSYIFNFKGEHNFPTMFWLNPKDFGVIHADDLWYFLNSTHYMDGWKTNEPGYSLVTFMNNIIGNFLDSREPLYTDNNGDRIKIWEPITDQNNLQYLQIGKEVKMIPEPHEKRFKFWESLGMVDMPPIDI